MIICQISVKVTMEETFVNSLASQIIRTLTNVPSLIKDGLGCLIILLQRQKPESLGKKYVSLELSSGAIRGGWSHLE
jgi:U3 small nucleolar RNA-associated protein 10